MNNLLIRNFKYAIQAMGILWLCLTMSGCIGWCNLSRPNITVDSRILRFGQPTTTITNDVSVSFVFTPFIGTPCENIWLDVIEGPLNVYFGEGRIIRLAEDRCIQLEGDWEISERRVEDTGDAFSGRYGWRRIVITATKVKIWVEIYGERSCLRFYSIPMTPKNRYSVHIETKKKSLLTVQSNWYLYGCFL